MKEGRRDWNAIAAVRLRVALCRALCLFIHVSVIVYGICQLFRSVWREIATPSMNWKCGFAALREASLSSWENMYQRFGGTLRCTRSTRTSVLMYQTTQYHIQEDGKHRSVLITSYL